MKCDDCKTIFAAYQRAVDEVWLDHDKYFAKKTNYKSLTFGELIDAARDHAIALRKAKKVEMKRVASLKKEKGEASPDDDGTLGEDGEEYANVMKRAASTPTTAEYRGCCEPGGCTVS